MLVGSNELARTILIEKWLKRVECRAKRLRCLNYIYAHILSCYGWLLVAIIKTSGILLKADEGIDLSTETVTVLVRKLAGKELVLLNRLLLEDALPGATPKVQKPLRPLNDLMSELRSLMRRLGDLSEDSDLARALRGLSLLTNEQARNPIVSLLEVNNLTRNYLLYAKGRVRRLHHSTFMLPRRWHLSVVLQTLRN